MIHSQDQEPQVLKPTGRLDAAAAPGLRHLIVDTLARQQKLIIVDLASVHYLSSSTLRVLLICHKSARREGGDLVLSSLQPQVLRIIRMVGFDRVLSVYENQELAREALISSARAGASSKEYDGR